METWETLLEQLKKEHKERDSVLQGISAVGYGTPEYANAVHQFSEHKKNAQKLIDKMSLLDQWGKLSNQERNDLLRNGGLPFYDKLSKFLIAVKEDGFGYDFQSDAPSYKSKKGYSLKDTVKGLVVLLDVMDIVIHKMEEASRKSALLGTQWFFSNCESSLQIIFNNMIDNLLENSKLKEWGNEKALDALKMELPLLLQDKESRKLLADLGEELPFG